MKKVTKAVFPDAGVRGKKERLHLVREATPEHINCIYILQTGAFGLRHPEVRDGFAACPNDPK